MKTQSPFPFTYACCTNDCVNRLIHKINQNQQPRVQKEQHMENAQLRVCHNLMKMAEKLILQQWVRKYCMCSISLLHPSQTHPRIYYYKQSQYSLSKKSNKGCETRPSSFTSTMHWPDVIPSAVTLAEAMNKSICSSDTLGHKQGRTTCEIMHLTK